MEQNNTKPADIADRVKGFISEPHDRDYLDLFGKTTQELLEQTPPMKPGTGGSGSGAPGQDGFSPIVSTSKTGDTTTISITDKTGTKTATIKDGAKGDKGDQGDSGVYVGSAAPASGNTANVWINNSDNLDLDTFAFTVTYDDGTHEDVNFAIIK